MRVNPSQRRMISLNWRIFRPLRLRLISYHLPLLPISCLLWMSRAFCFLAFVCLLGSSLGDQRRIGKRHDLSWTPHYQLGTNYDTYASSEEYPALSVVG